MTDLSDYLLGQIAQTTRSTESELHELKETVEEQSERLDRIRAALAEITAWGHRLMVLAMIWSVAVGVNVAPERAAEFIAMLLKSAR